jgi:RNA polymerase-binding transcription factor DksA
MTETAPFKEKLEEEKVTLEEQLSTIGKPDPENPGSWQATQTDTTQEADVHGQADLLDQYQENRAILDVLNARYQEVTAALERMDAGTYGTCEVSGELIEKERLEADPAARTCIAHISQTPQSI